MNRLVVRSTRNASENEWEIMKKQWKSYTNYIENPCKNHSKSMPKSLKMVVWAALGPLGGYLGAISAPGREKVRKYRVACTLQGSLLGSYFRGFWWFFGTVFSMRFWRGSRTPFFSILGPIEVPKSPKMRPKSIPDQKKSTFIDNWKNLQNHCTAIKNQGFGTSQKSIFRIEMLFFW